MKTNINHAQRACSPRSHRAHRAGILGVTALSMAAFWTPSAYAQGENTEAEEIYVTARKTLETLQEAPISVSVVGADQIENLVLQSVADIALTTPGLFLDDGFGRSGNDRPIIRGQANILGDSGVSYFIDGIYYTGSISDFDVTQIERVEVIKGPQSALYGRNTYSGAINIITKSAGDELSARAAVDISENDRYEFNGGISGPIAGGLSGGIFGRFVDFGGQFVNQFDGSRLGQQQSWALSGVLNFDNGGPVTARLRGYYNRQDDGQPAIFATSASENNCFTDNGGLYQGDGRYFCGAIQPREMSSDYTRQFADPDSVGIEGETINVSLGIDWEVSDTVIITSLSGYNRNDETQITDGDYTGDSFQIARFARFPIGGPTFGPTGPTFPFGFVGSVVDFSFANTGVTEDFSQELRLNYTNDRVNAILGGYFFQQSSDSRDVRDLPADAAALAAANFGAAIGIESGLCAANPICSSVVPLFGPTLIESRNENNSDIRNIAAFGMLEYAFTDSVSLSTELRYSSEKVEQITRNFNAGDDRPDGDFAEATFDALDVRVTGNWQLSPDNLLFAIVATGQKPGGLNGPEAIAAGQPTFDVEEVTAFEIGSKNVLLDGRLTANFAVFYNSVRGYQLTQNVFIPEEGRSVSAIRNVGNADIYGAEIELTYRLTDEITLSGNYALASSTFSQGLDENQGVLLDAADNGLVDCSTGDQFPDEADCTSLFGSIAGNTIPRAPQHQAFVDIDYRTDMSGDWQLFGGANMRFVSRTFAQVANEAFTEPVATVDARLGITNGRYRLQAYVRNLFDDGTPTQLIRYADGNDSFKRSFIGAPRLGRRVGVNLSVTY